jgi:hypothetical protein
MDIMQISNFFRHCGDRRPRRLRHDGREDRERSADLLRAVVRLRHAPGPSTTVRIGAMTALDYVNARPGGFETEADTQPHRQHYAPKTLSFNWLEIWPIAA